MMKELKAFYMAHGAIAKKLQMTTSLVMELNPKFLDKLLDKHSTSYQDEIDKAMTELIGKKEEEE